MDKVSPGKKLKKGLRDQSRFELWAKRGKKKKNERGSKIRYDLSRGDFFPAAVSSRLDLASRLMETSRHTGEKRWLSLGIVRVITFARVDMLGQRMPSDDKSTPRETRGCKEVSSVYI